MWEGDVWVAVKAARQGVEIVARGMKDPFDVEMKGESDPVTVVDRDAEEAIMSVIRSHFPTDHLLGEEGGGDAWDQGRVWIVDPLDGTVNFVRRMPHVAVSVALYENGQPLIGVIIDVARGEEFVAVANEGATLNAEPISVSATGVMDQALVATGFPYDRRQRASAYLKVVEEVMTRTMGTRRLGAAALDLAWVACGRFDAYWEHGGTNGVKPWDVAAGVLLVREAGGRVTDHAGKQGDLLAKAFVATNGKFHDEFRSVIAANMPDHL